MIAGTLAARNALRLAQWRERWFLRGGSAHWTARNLPDLRNCEDLRRWRHVEGRLREAWRWLLTGATRQPERSVIRFGTAASSGRLQ